MILPICSSRSASTADKIRLLTDDLAAAGSITAAALHLGMSYRRAWLLVKAINDAMQQPAVAASQGGIDGGGTARCSFGGSAAIAPST
jgi:molybdate transport repressor ModE-like protein